MVVIDTIILCTNAFVAGGMHFAAKKLMKTEPDNPMVKHARNVAYGLLALNSLAIIL